MENQRTKRLLSLVMVILGNILYAFSLKFFVIPANLMSCGTTGIALVVNHLTNIPLSTFIFAFNMVMLVIGWVILGRKFAMTTILSSLFYPIALELLNRIFGDVLITENTLLNTVFGGICLGISLGIVLRAGASTGGMDIPPPMYKKGGVFICPTQKNVHETWKAYISYGINRDFVGRENYAVRQWASSKVGPVKASSVTQPSSHLIVTETWYSYNKTQECKIGSLKVPARTLGNYVAHHDSIAFRHSRKTNTLYVDGHVAADDQSWIWMGHPLKYPWNVGNASTGNAFSLYPNRKSWEEERGYDPYY